MKMLNITSSAILLVLVLYILHIGKSLFLPLVISIVVWYIIVVIAAEFENIKIKNKKWIPKWLAILLSLITMGSVIWFLTFLINTNVNGVVKAAPEYQAKFQGLVTVVQKKLISLGISEMPRYEQIFGSINVASILSGIGGMLTSVAGYTGMMLVYVLLLLLEFHTFDRKLTAIFPDKERHDKAKNILSNISRDINSYIKIKTCSSLLTGIFSYVVLVLVGVDFATFWALLIFLLNYIPTFGSIVGVIFPLILTIVQFESALHFTVVLISLTSVQFVIGNVLEPKLMGQSLNLSPLVIIISLALWGKIWGITGMFLCVPIMVIINIVLSKFETTRPVAIMLSVKGNIK